MFKVFDIGKEQGRAKEKEFQIFWCPSAPHTYTDKVPHDTKIYPYRQSAHRKCKLLNERKTRDDKVLETRKTK